MLLATENYTIPTNNVGIALNLQQHNHLLTPREIEILELASKGYTSAKIASHIYLSVDTIEGHRKSIIRKMDVANITHAVAEALRKKWIV